MEFFVDAFNIILYQPLFNALILLYQYLPGQDFGVAVIVLTIFIKILLYPLGTQAVLTQKALQALQPKIKEIQEKYKKDREKQVRMILELYRKEKINPFSGLLSLMIQLPILIALFQVFWKGFGPDQLTALYDFVPYPGQVNTTFFGILDLNKPSIVLAIFAGIFQFIQSKMFTLQKSSRQEKGTFDFSQIMQKQILYFFPILTFIILLKLPSAIGLYWVVMTIFTILQQYFILKKN